MRHWIEDPDCRDQYSVIYEAGERTAIFNNDAKDPITVEERAVSIWALCQMASSKACTRCDNCVFLCSAGQRHMCAGLLKAPTWQPSINAVLHYGAARSSSRFRGSAIWACHSLTSHPVKGEQHPCSAELFCVTILKPLTKHFILSVFKHQ